MHTLAAQLVYLSQRGEVEVVIAVSFSIFPELQRGYKRIRE